VGSVRRPVTCAARAGQVDFRLAAAELALTDAEWALLEPLFPDQPPGSAACRPVTGW
jgi:hypothetical protein